MKRYALWWLDLHSVDVDRLTAEDKIARARREVFASERARPGRRRTEAPWEGHSRKPEIFANLITAYYPTAPKPDGAKARTVLRALDDPEAERVRRARCEANGWYFWGNEAETDLAGEPAVTSPPHRGSQKRIALCCCRD